jgi:enterochelin esterase-like enzyme
VLELKRWYPICVVAICSFFFLGYSLEAFAAGHPCCPEDGELSYLLSPKPSQKFQYLVRYETFFSNVLGKEKGFFIILPEGFYQNRNAKYPVLSLLHGYNFERRGFWWKVYSPEKAKKVFCESKEEEYHWLVHEDIAIIAYAMMDSRNRTYLDLEKSLEERFEELSKYGGLAKGDYTPKEIAQSIVSHNLHPGPNSDEPFHPLQKMVILLPDGDNGFYTDENEGKRLYPEVKDQMACDHFNSGEALNYSLLPFLYMVPGALGKYESYFLEFLQHVESRSSYRERLFPKRGLGGFSMGGFGATKLGLKYPRVFQSLSSQSGLLDIELLKDRLVLKMIMPEFLEVFGRLESQKLPSGSSLDLKHIQENNPLTLIKRMGINQLPHWLYFDYGQKERFEGITKGNQNVEKALKEDSHQIPVQAFNGKSKHNNQFWRSRSGNVLKHHSDVLQKEVK